MWILGAPAFYPPLTIIASHPAYVTREYRLLAIGVVALGLALAIAAVLDRTAVRSASTELAFIVLSVVMWAGLVDRASSLPGGMLGIVALLLFWIIWHVRFSSLFKGIVTWISVFLWLSVSAGALQTAINWGKNSIPPAEQIDAVAHEAGTDIIFVVFDGFPSSQLSFPELENLTTPLLERLTDRGFWVKGDAGASYSMTRVAIPAMLDMRLLLDEGDTVSHATQAELARISGGGGRLFSLLRDAGFHVTIVESGWSPLRCIHSTDTCIGRPWLDDATIRIVRNSIVGLLVPQTRLHDWNSGIEAVNAWITNDLSDLMTNDRSDFIFIHTLLPHPPGLYDPQCEQTNDNTEYLHFREQVECAVMVMEWIADSSSGANIVFVGDHGSNLHAQIFMPPDEWDQPMVDERMHTLVALREEESCGQMKPMSNTNATVWLARCLGAEVGWVDDVSFASSDLKEDPLLRVR